MAGNSGVVYTVQQNRAVTTFPSVEKPPATEQLIHEAGLIKRILGGQKDLFYELIAPCERMAYGSALSILCNEAEAEDCCQDAFIKAFYHLASFRGESKFGSWLVRIVVNEAKMRLRKMRPEIHESLDETVEYEDGEYISESLGDYRHTPSEALEHKELSEALEKGIKKLRTIYRMVFVLRDVDGLSVAATAQILNVTESTVKTRLLRARLQLRDMLAAHSCITSRRTFKSRRNP